jgi:hypothetical protein
VWVWGRPVCGPLFSLFLSTIASACIYFLVIVVSLLTEAIRISLMPMTSQYVCRFVVFGMNDYVHTAANNIVMLFAFAGM